MSLFIVVLVAAAAFGSGAVLPAQGWEAALAWFALSMAIALGLVRLWAAKHSTANRM